jgi:hypothetical protein
MRRLLPIVLMLAACGTNAAVETATTTGVAPTTERGGVVPTAIESTTTTTPVLVVLDELVWQPNVSRRLDPEVRYRAELSGVQVEVAPSQGNWKLLGLGRKAMLLAWAGPSGFRDETLDVLVFDVGDDGIDAAWRRIGARLDGELESTGEEWAWSKEGVAVVGEMDVEWREVRVPDVRLSPEDPRVVDLSDVGRATLWAGTSARVFVVPVEDFTVTLVGYEARCACSFQQSWARFGHVDDVENELSMWIPELEAFLAAMSLEVP